VKNNWDVIVIGGGIIGLSIAWALRKRGATVLVVERGEPGLEASYAAAGMLADTPIELPAALHELARASAQMYPGFVHEIEDESGTKVDLRDQGTIFLSGEERLPLASLEPALVDQPAVFFKERSVDPRALGVAMLKAAKHRGVDIATGSNVTGVFYGGVDTEKTRYYGAKVVNCAGAWAGQVGPVPFPTRPVKGQMLALVGPRELVRHVVRWHGGYLVPRSDGRIVVGSTLEEAGFDKRVDVETIRGLHQAALRHVPRLAECRILEDWAGLRPATPDGLPLLGATSVPGYFVAGGHFRDGILLTPVTAAVMASVISGEKPGFDLSAFAAGRFAGS
jgi:glycine oxidase